MRPKGSSLRSEGIRELRNNDTAENEAADGAEVVYGNHASYPLGTGGLAAGVGAG